MQTLTTAQMEASSLGKWAAPNRQSSLTVWCVGSRAGPGTLRFIHTNRGHYLRSEGSLSLINREVAFPYQFSLVLALNFHNTICNVIRLTCY
jgi:hypothetical protein